MRCWWWHTWPHFLVLCWLEWKAAALCCFQPIQFKVKWCVLSEMSFCTLLLYWAVTYLRPVEQVLPLSLPWLLSRATGVVTLKAASDIWCSLLKLSYSFHFLIFIFFFWMYCPVKKKRSGIIFEGYLFELISGHLRGSGMYSFYSFDLSLTFNIGTINCNVKFKNPQNIISLNAIEQHNIWWVWSLKDWQIFFFLCTIRERGADVFSSQFRPV